MKICHGLGKAHGPVASVARTRLSRSGSAAGFGRGNNRGFGKVDLRLCLRTLLRLDDADERPNSGPVILTAAMEMRCRGSQLKIVIRSGNAADEAKPDMALIKAVARAHDWFEQLATGEVRNVLDIAKEEGLTRPYVSRVMKLAFLAPELVEAILDGGQPADLTVDEITLGEAVPAQWEKQAEALSGSRRLS